MVVLVVVGASRWWARPRRCTAARPPPSASTQPATTVRARHRTRLRQGSTSHQVKVAIPTAVEQNAAQAALRLRVRRRAPSPTVPAITQTQQTAGGSLQRRRALRFELRLRRSTQRQDTTL